MTVMGQETVEMNVHLMGDLVAEARRAADLLLQTEQRLRYHGDNAIANRMRTQYETLDNVARMAEERLIIHADTERHHRRDGGRRHLSTEERLAPRPIDGETDSEETDWDMAGDLTRIRMVIEEMDRRNRYP